MSTSDPLARFLRKGPDMTRPCPSVTRRTRTRTIGRALLLLGSALLFLHILAKSQKRGEAVEAATVEIRYAESEHPVTRVPALLNGFGFWNVVILALMLANFGYPIAQFFLTKTFGSTGWGY